MKKKKYDTSVVMLYLIGKEGLLPKPFRKQIPYSTISSWRKNGIHSYVGNEYRYLFLDNFNYAELKEEHRRVYKILKSISRVWVLLHQYSYPLIELAKKDPLLQKRLLVAVGLLQEHLGIRKALKVFGISGSLYKLWSSLSEAHCSHSATSVCARRYPQQLHRQEAMKMKHLLTCAKYANWPIVSIAGLGLRKNSVVASLFTWYKYARLWQIKPVEQNKELKITGLVSTRPNEYLHIDTTFYNLNEAHKACIAFVVDNFSRMILGFHVAEKKTFSLAKIALQNALQTIALHPDLSHSFLVSDGGSENHHSEINRFLTALSDYKISKVVALKDIRFSNSAVEAIHRIMKGRYLRNQKFASIDELKTFLTRSVHDYNSLRPHYKKHPLTPEEVYYGKKLNFDVKTRIEKAVEKRKTINRNSTCSACSNIQLSSIMNSQPSTIAK